MKKILLLTKLFLLMAVLSVNAQINFDELEMPTYKNGSNGAGKFQSGGATFINYYNSTYGSWSGFAVSKASDTETSGYGNQYSSITGGGSDDENFMVACIGAYNGPTYIKLTSAQNVARMKVTNNTFAHNSMRDGDSFAKKFGSSTDANGEDDGTNGEDWFLLSVKGYKDGSYTDSIGFYLADFTDANDDNDYIIDTWESVDLSSLGLVDSLVFDLTSSDNGDWGMNTPAYFCMDDLELGSTSVNFAEYDFDYWNGEDLTGNFTSGDIEFGNVFYPNSWGGSWTGFAYSRKTDNTTSGYFNQYSAVTGEGYNGSENYAVGYGTPGLKLNQATYIRSIEVTNSTYAHNSMRDGDLFAKEFGSSTDANGEDDGTDGKDWFLLSIKGYKNGNYIDSVGFYLADFTADNDEDDYIVDSWESVDLTSLGIVDSLAFSLSSTDNGDWGMNTPAYFCMDNITLSSVGISDVKTSEINIFPNPAKDFIIVKANQISKIQIMDISGKVLYSRKTELNRVKVDVSSLEAGIYIVLVKNQDSTYTQKIIKQ